MHPNPELRSRWQQIALGTLGVATALRVGLVLSGVLEGGFVADDAYYYFTIARHLAEGLGPTFDGLAATNGFHPLWQFALVPCFRVFGDLWRPVRAALLLTVALDLITAWRLYRIARVRAQPDRGWLAVVLWCASPFGLLLGLRGMESSVSTLTIVLLVEAVARPSPAGMTFRRTLLVGGLLGASGLARTDNLATVGVATAAVVLWGSPTASRLRARLGQLAVVGVTAAAVVSPWFWWSWTRFGQLVQVSGLVKRSSEQIFGTLPHALSPWPAAASTLAHAAFAPVLVPVRRLGGQEFGTGHTWHWIAAALVLGGGVLLLLAATRRALWTGLARPVATFIGVYLPAHALLFGAVWRAYADWYAAPTYALLAVGLALAVDPLASAGPVLRRSATVAAAVTCVGLTALSISHELLFPYDARRPERRWRPLLEHALALRPLGARLGAWDAGMAGYVATSYPALTVVNLDGLVNNQVFEAVQRGDYMGYLLRTVDFYLQDPGRARMYLDREQVNELKRRVGGPPP